MSREARWEAFAALLLAACAPRPAGAVPEQCAPATAPDARMPPGQSLAGEYRVRLVATSGPRPEASTDGMLALHPPQPGDTARFVLLGRGDLSLEDVGAAEGEVSSDDPMRPGAVLFELPGPRLLVRLGAEANRRDVRRVEGAYTVLEIRTADSSGFAGAWRSGAPQPVAEGYFCAWRAPAGGD